MIKTRVKLDPWQIKFLETSGNKILCTGRQVGKSMTCGIDAGEYAMRNKNKTILMIAPTERQAYALFEKTLNHVVDTKPLLICKGKDRPTKTRFKLTNGTAVWCLPVGMSGLGIRFLTINRLYADEASRIPEDVWHAVTPMLLTTGGDQIYLSTPNGKQGYYYTCWENKDNSFSKFFISSEEAIRNREICSTWSEIQRDKGLQYLKEERQRMTRLQYAQEYEGQFVEEILQFFSDELIRSAMRNQGAKVTSNSVYATATPSSDLFLGIDVARMGGDDSVFFVIHRDYRGNLTEIDKRVFNMTTIPETYRLIKELDKKYRFRKIYIDDGGLGVGVSDLLLEDDQTKRKTMPINNASRFVDAKKNKRKLMKEELYCNLKVLMEQGKLRLKLDEKTFESLKSIQADTTNNKLTIWGRYTHITEALIRACWCVKDKGLNIWIL